MIVNDIFNSVLIEPAQRGADRLYIVSGYATAAMAFHHLDSLDSQRRRIRIQLIIGMCPLDGLSITNHRGFRQLMEADFLGRFECSYVMNPPPVHSKVYGWFRGNAPIAGFSGSANYTQVAFRSRQREAMVEFDAQEAYDYFQSLAADTIYCTNGEAENCVQIYNDEYTRRGERYTEAAERGEEVPANLVGLPSVRVSLLDRSGNLPQRSGLNWGQRPELNREPNQAYIRLPSTVYSTDFFPQRGVHFTVLTDDGRVLICTRAQANGKAIHTPHNNSLIGEYFRNRLGITSGEAVAKQDLINYGRTDATFHKIDDETYYMDFSV